MGKNENYKKLIVDYLDFSYHKEGGPFVDVEGGSCCCCSREWNLSLEEVTQLIAFLDEFVHHVKSRN